MRDILEMRSSLTYWYRGPPLSPRWWSPKTTRKILQCRCSGKFSERKPSC